MKELPFDLNRLIELCRQNHVTRISLFGSVVSGEDSEQSDVDMVVEFSQRISLLRFTALERQFSEAIGKKVDLLTEQAISPYLREKIQRDLQVIYETR